MIRLPGVERVFLDTVEGPNDELQLVAYVVARQSSSAGVLRRALRAVLPRHMIPTAFVFLEEFPLTSHGKVDRDKLRQVHSLGSVRQSTEQQTTATELLLAGIWSEVFDLAEVHRHDDFFDLGGNSLTAATVAVRIHAALENHARSRRLPRSFHARRTGRDHRANAWRENHRRCAAVRSNPTWR